MAEAAVHAPRTGNRAVRWPLRLASTVTLVILAGVVTAASLITLRVIRDQERLILRERTGEAAAVLGSAFSGIQQSLGLLRTVTGAGANPRLFAAAARSVVTSSAQGVLVTAQRGTGMRVIASAGRAPAVGQALPADQQRLARRALATTGMVTGLFRDGSRRVLAFALGRAAGRGTVVWDQSVLAAHTSVKSGQASPWGNLNIAIYLSSRPDPADLILTTTPSPPPTGLRYPLKVGTDTWLLVTSSPRPLVGMLAEDMPWIILAIGGIAALLVTTVVETLSRRRDYAAALVEERTASLQHAMSELEETQAQLVRTEKLAAVGQLASTVGHELRNPLAVVMNALYLLETGLAGNPGMGRHLATAKREISAATLIVSDLLDYSRSREPIIVPVQVADLVSEALSVVPPPTGVQVVQDSDPDLTIDADRDQIRQALLNLITNGYDSMPAGGVLTVSATAVAGSAQITVTDTGSGMDEQTREAIFAPFYTTKARGIGLGLAVTKRVVEAHGGTITVQSAPSAGSSFTIAVPAAAAKVSVTQ